jgi:uncharacterized membrane-anchored protein YhcB (DUF1043 family)
VTTMPATEMLWIGAAVALVAGIVAPMVVVLGKRPVKADELGSVSAQH